MKNLIKNETAIMNPIISLILSLAVITITYFMFMPMLTFITNVLIQMGAPADQTMFFLKCARWGFLLFGIGALLILLAKVWKKTHDTGIQEVY